MRTTKIIFALLCAVLATHGSAISRELHKDPPTQKSFSESSQFSFWFIPHKATNQIIGYKFNPKFEESAQLLGLQPGDTIMKINGVRVTNMEVMTRMFTKIVTEDLELEILRKGVVLGVTASLTPTPQLAQCTEQLEITRESIRPGMGQEDLFKILGDPNTLSFQSSDAGLLLVAIYDVASFVFDSTLLIDEIVLHPEQCDA